MPRHGLTIAALALGLAACDQRTSQPPSSSAASASAAPQSTTAPSSGAPVVFAGAPYVASRTYFKLQDAYPSALLLCDGVNRPEALIVGQPDNEHNLTIISLNKQTGERTPTTLKVEPVEAAAGNDYWGLANMDGSDAGYLRAFHPGLIDHPESVTTPPLTSIKLGDDITSCRWVPNTVVEAIDQRRSYLITSEAGELVYRTFNYADPVQPIQEAAGATSKPSLEIRGGTETATPTGKLYTFENKGYRYTVEIGDAAHPTGSMRVVWFKRPITAEPFEAYTTAR